jgi:hypothetical protein
VTKKALRLIGGVIAAVVAVWLILLVSGVRLLVYETRVEPGDNYLLPDWGNLGEAEQAQLVCYYFTGRSVKPWVEWYSANTIIFLALISAHLSDANDHSA